MAYAASTSASQLLALEKDPGFRKVICTKCGKEIYMDIPGTTTYFGYQKLYPNVVDESNVYTSQNSNQVYYIVIDNTGKAGEAKPGRDVSVHTIVEQL